MRSNLVESSSSECILNITSAACMLWARLQLGNFLHLLIVLF